MIVFVLAPSEQQLIDRLLPGWRIRVILLLLLDRKVVGLHSLAVQQDRQHQGLGKEVLCNLNVEGAEVRRLHLFALRFRELLQALGVLLRCPDVDLVSHLHELGGLGDKVGGQAGLDGHVPRVQVHVAALDALDAHRSQRCKVVGEADRGHHLGDLCRSWVAHDLQCVYVARVGGQGATLGSHCDWELDSLSSRR